MLKFLAGTADEEKLRRRSTAEAGGTDRRLARKDGIAGFRKRGNNGDGKHPIILLSENPSADERLTCGAVNHQGIQTNQSAGRCVSRSFGGERIHDRGRRTR
jgi:hypothetical protein